MRTGMNYRFISELRALMEKFEIYIEEWEHYDGEGKYAGSTYEFIGPHICISIGKELNGETKN